MTIPYDEWSANAWCVFDGTSAPAGAQRAIEIVGTDDGGYRMAFTNLRVAENATIVVEVEWQ